MSRMAQGSFEESEQRANQPHEIATRWVSSEQTRKEGRKGSKRQRGGGDDGLQQTGLKDIK